MIEQLIYALYKKLVKSIGYYCFIKDDFWVQSLFWMMNQMIYFRSNHESKNYK